MTTFLHVGKFWMNCCVGCVRGCIFVENHKSMILKILRSDIKEAVVALRNWLFFRRQSFKMGLAIRLADMKQRAWNKQYHVMLVELPDGERLVSVNNQDINRFKRKRWLPKKTGMHELKKEGSIFYSTPLDRNNRSTAADRAAAKEKYLRYARKYMK